MLLAIADVLLTMAALGLALLVRQVLPWGKFIAPGDPLLSPVVCGIVALLWPVVFQTLGVYDSQYATRAGVQISRLTLAVPVGAFVMGGVLYFTFREISRLLVIYFAQGYIAFGVAIKTEHFPSRPIYLQQRAVLPRLRPAQICWRSHIHQGYRKALIRRSFREQVELQENFARRGVIGE